jgi:hypothetical protein
MEQECAKSLPKASWTDIYFVRSLQINEPIPSSYIVLLIMHLLLETTLGYTPKAINNLNGGSFQQDALACSHGG